MFRTAKTIALVALSALAISCLTCGTNRKRKNQINMNAKKIIIYLMAAITCLSSCGGHKAPAESDFIRIDGENLVAPDGSQFFIMGTNLGNWLNPEGYMFGFGKANSPRLINEAFCELVGPDFTADFWKQFKDSYITRDDIKFISECGANTIRIPFNYRLFNDEYYMGSSSDEEGFLRINSVVEWCREFGMYVILDMHDAPGGQTGDNIDDSYGYPWLFESEASQKLFCDIWTRIANHYKNEPVVLGYELCNEPIAPYFENMDAMNDSLEPLYKRAVEAIRTVDTNHIILLGAAQWNSNFKVFKDTRFDDKLMYTCHRYGGDATAEAIDGFISFRDSSGLPMYMGEIGHNTMEWQSSFSQVMQENNIGYTYWPFKKIGDSCMLGISRPESWQTVVDFAESDRGDFGKVRANRPDQAVARAAMTEFLELCKFQRCIPQDEYIASMRLK